MVELRHLRYFIKAAELLHFTKAAESLHISQPTLSIHVQQMEDELGVELFARVGRHVRLTEAGEILLLRARNAVTQVDQASEEIGALRGLLRGTLSLSALPAHGVKLLPGWISAFRSKYPNVSVKARSGSSEDIEKGVISGVIDIGIAVLPVDHDEINSVELMTDDVVVIVSKHHQLAANKTLELDQLGNLPLALPSSRISWIRNLNRYLAQLGIQPQIAVEHDDGNALIEMVKVGDLATLLPKSAVTEDPSLRYWALPGAGLRTTTVALWTYLSPAAKAFLAVLTEESGSKKKS